MKLYTTHIIHFGPIDLPQSDLLYDLKRELGIGEIISSPGLTEGLSEYLSKALKIRNFLKPTSVDFKIESATLSIFEGGFGTYEITANVSEKITTNGLVELSDKLTTDIENYISKDLLSIKISKFFGNWFTADETDHKPPSLMWAYSQTCVFEKIESFEKFSKSLNDDEVRNYGECKVKFDPTATAIYFNANGRIETILELIKSVTLSTALAYNIRNTSIKLSREILQNPILENKFSSIDRYVRLVNVMDQYLAEIYQDDLIANLNEVKFAKPLSIEFELSEVLNKAFRAVARLKDHIGTLENEITRKQQKRMNNILFAFTLLSIVSLVGGVISLYDFANQISPNIRLGIVFISFVLSVTIILYLMKRFNETRVKNKR